MPSGGGGGGDQAGGGDALVEEGRSVYRGPTLSHRARGVLVAKSFTENLEGSNSMEQELSVVNGWTKRRLWVI
jgi:hypothetical protein